MKDKPMERLTESLTVKLSPRLAARLGATARKRGKTRSAVVREALENRLAREDLSFLDLAWDYVGSIEGPGDLSTNKRYLWKTTPRKRPRTKAT